MLCLTFGAVPEEEHRMLSLVINAVEFVGRGQQVRLDIQCLRSILKCNELNSTLYSVHTYLVTDYSLTATNLHPRNVPHHLTGRLLGSG